MSGAELHKIKKSVLRPGNGHRQDLVSGMFVSVSIKAVNLDDPIDPLFDVTLEWQWEIVSPKVDDEFLCPAITNVVLSMTPGEKCRVQYGPSTGSPQSHEGDAKCPHLCHKRTYELELLRVTEELPCSPLNDGGVTIRILNAGIERTQPRDFASITVDYRLLLTSTGEKIEDTYESQNPLKFRLGCCEVMPGLDLVLRLMKKGSVAILKLSPDYAFGPFRYLPEDYRSPTPDNENLNFKEYDEKTGPLPELLAAAMHKNTDSEMLADYKDSDPHRWRVYSANYCGQAVEFHDLHVVEIENSLQSWHIESEKEKVEMCAKHLDLGKNLYFENRYTAARKSLDQAKDCLDNVLNSTDAELRASAEHLICDVLFGLSLVFFHRGNFTKALSCSTQCSKVDTTDTDVLWQRARCMRHLENLDLANSTIDMAIDIDGNQDSKLIKEKQLIKRREAEVTRRYASIFRGAFSGDKRQGAKEPKQNKSPQAPRSSLQKHEEHPSYSARKDVDTMPS